MATEITIWFLKGGLRVANVLIIAYRNINSLVQ